MQRYLLSLSLTTLLFSNHIYTKNITIQTSYENLKISSTEYMGLLGVDYLFDYNSFFNYGFSVYGAVSGDRGGFFVGGVKLEASEPLDNNIYLNQTIFAGGGGGASAGQGGGLMLRGFIGAEYRRKKHSIKVGYSKVKFPNGSIDSSQLSFAISSKFKSLFLSDSFDKTLLKNYPLTKSKSYILSTFQTYHPKSSKTRSGLPLTKNISLIGVEYGSFFSNEFFSYLESAGAVHNATGYMEILAGLGYKKELFKNLNFKAKLSLGASGGGRVDSGGGAMAKASFSLDYLPTKRFITSLGVGKLKAYDGEFDADLVNLSLGIKTNFLSLGDKKDVDFDKIYTQKFSIKVINQTYFYSKNLTTNNNKNDIQLMGIGLDWYLTKNLYLSGEAFGAYKGDAGGYAVGMFGLGYEKPITNRLSFVTELHIGASGGGSINSEGKIIQPMAGFGYNFDKLNSIELMGGKVKSLSSNMNSNLFHISYTHRFDKFMSK